MGTVTLDLSKAQPIQAPVTLDLSKAQALAPQGTAGQRLRDNFASGLGVTDDEGAKNFFEHPINTLMQSLDQQGQLALKAKAAYAKGDYKGALMYGLNYLVPFIGQQTAKAGEQLEQGDIAGGVGRTLGAAVPMVAGSPEAQTAAGNAASATARVAKPVVAAVGERLPEIAGGATGAYLGHASGLPEMGLVGGLAGRELAKSVVNKLKGLSDTLETSQRMHANVLDLDDLDATAENKPYAGETARGRKLAAAPQAAPVAAGTSETPAQPAAAVPSAPSFQFTSRPRVVPSVQNIRENIAQANAAEAQPSRLTADALDDHALSQEMNWDLERHGWAADSEARREFIARNSTGVTKAELTGAAEKPVRYTKTPGVPSPGTPATDDLTDLLQRSLDAAKKAKAQQP